MTEFNSGIALSANEIKPLLVGKKITSNNEIYEKIKGKPSILIFYRGGWCPYCNVHFQELKKIEDQLIELGYTIMAVSPDLSEKLSDTRKKYSLNYDLISDCKLEITKGFGLVYHLDDSTVAMYKTHGLDIEGASGETHHLLPVPAVYVISEDGTVLFNYVNPDYKTRLNPEILLSTAKVFKKA